MANNSNKVSQQLEAWSDLERGDHRVLITGASSGFGCRDFSINLAKTGSKVIAAARRVDHLKTFCNLINKSNSPGSPLAMPLELDITSDPPVTEAAVQKALAAFGHIDVLINNAGVSGNRSHRVMFNSIRTIYYISK